MDKGAADHLVSEASGAFEMELYRGRMLRIDSFEGELVKQVVVLGRESESFDGLAVENDIQRSVRVGRAELRGEQ
ncbi:MAG: hypothetical protein ACJ72H_27905 [Candidatus Sulfotelmatobacter sp.]